MLTDERGAVGVVVAILMVPLLGFAAVAIDVAAMYAERQELQTGADAGAVAIAQDCGLGACTATAETAQAFATSNLRHSSSTATVTELSAGQVTVRNAGIRQHLFAPVLGVDSSTISASATVAWGSPTGGTDLLPLAISWCEWQAQTGGSLPSGTAKQRIISFPTKSEPGCTPPSKKPVPAGFGWLDTNSRTCATTSSISEHVESSTGDNPSSRCNPADFVAMQGRTVLLPLFDDSGGSDSKAWYQIYGYAAFKITGYYFGGQYNWGSPCGGTERCIRGYFTRLVDLNATLTDDSNAPQLGASTARLIR